MLTGLSAFPLTPAPGGVVDEPAFAPLVERLAAAGVDSIGALGSTGGAAYLDRGERARGARIAVAAAGGVPVLVGVGAVSTREVLLQVEDAADAGAAGVLLAPVSYQPLTAAEVRGLYEDVAERTALPVVVYDNPATTGFAFDDALLAEVAALPRVVSIKLSGVEDDPAAARARLDRLRASVPDGTTLGISGDAMAARGLLAGCDVWYSVLGGTAPRTCLAIAQAALAGDAERAAALSARLEPVWALFARYGSHRVVSAIAAETGLLAEEPLHRPLRPIPRAEVVAALRATGPLD